MTAAGCCVWTKKLTSQILRLGMGSEIAVFLLLALDEFYPVLLFQLKGAQVFQF